MDLKDSITTGVRIYRDSSSDIEQDRKATPKGVEATAQDTATGAMTVQNAGDEQGWGYTPPTNPATNRNGLGSYSQAYPAVLSNTDGKVYAINDKTLISDTDYKGKTVASAAEDTAEKVADASLVTWGTPGVVVTCLNDTSQEQIFVPSGGVLKVDHKSGGNLSTKVSDVKADGALDPANIGTLKDVFYVDSNELQLATTAKFNDGGTKKGAVNFETSSYPATVTPTTPANYAVKLAWDSAEGKWKLYCIGEASTTSLKYALVRWNFTVTDGDLSEGELLNYDDATDTYAPLGSPEAIWIDWGKSAQCQFHTAGDGTVFSVRLVKAGVTRGATTRDLYACVQCVKDAGSPITDFSIITIWGSNRLDVYALSDSLVNPVWSNEPSARISTTVLSNLLENIMVVSIPSEWYTESGTLGNYAFTELHDLSKGLYFWARPVRPVLTDLATLEYESAEQVTGSTIATYQKV